MRGTFRRLSRFMFAMWLDDDRMTCQVGCADPHQADLCCAAWTTQGLRQNMERLCRLVVLVLAISAVGGVAATSSLAGVDQVEVYKAGDKDNTGLQYNCFRIPALISTTAGRVYAFAEGRRTGCNDHGDVRIVVRVSEDGGSTFGPIMQVVSEEGHTIGNPAPVVDSLSSPGDDIIHLIYSRDNHQVWLVWQSMAADRLC